jgi:ABC-2 type transport system ATP-binding protein
MADSLTLARVPSESAAIEVVDLVKHYGEVRAVDGVSLRIATGEVFGLLGPNGAGKTTAVEILEGYRAPDAGEVRVLGLDPVREGGRLRPRIGVMLQEGGLYPGLRPLELLRLFAAYFEHPVDTDELLDTVGLRDAARTLVRRLSGGQKQRLSLALALVGRPEVVFLDEPTAGMDPHARATTWRLVRELAEGGVTVMLTTHGMDEAEHLCDRVAIVDHGRVVAGGSLAEMKRVSGRRVVRLAVEGSVAPAWLGALPGVVGVRLAAGHAELDVASGVEPSSILKAAVDRGATVTRFEIAEPSLEALFIEHVGRAPEDVEAA